MVPIVLLLIFGQGLCQNPLIRTNSGLVRGYIADSTRDGTKYAAFLGIPYAEAPLRDLRFKAPVPVVHWDGVRDATQYGHQCWANETDINQDEDCLFINVYTPAIPPSNGPKSVMVYLHGGAFTRGGSNIYSPDWFMDNDVVFVTVNYRLGPLGFLNLGTPDIPGNAGLKDQLLALQWVHDNIDAFGGDPQQVTIFGESAGSASVSLFQLNKKTEGLFKRIIMESGCSLDNWVVQTQEVAVEHAHKLAQLINCKSQDLHELYTCLRDSSAYNLTVLQSDALTEDDIDHMRSLVFTPSLEPESPEAFLTRLPKDILADKDYIKVPIIIGSNARESIYSLPTINKWDPTGVNTEKFGRNGSNFIPEDLLMSLNKSQTEEVGQKIKSFYVNGEFTLENRIQLLDMKTDLDFVLDIQRLALILAEDSQMRVYNYQFTFDGAFNYFKTVLNLTDIPGAIHVDELGYLMNLPVLQDLYLNYSRNSTEQKVVDRMIRMWTNFAKYGDPTPSTDDVITTRWQPLKPNQFHYLEIGPELAAKQGLASERMQFWNNVYEQYQNKRPFPQ